jgi:hypothetical protein
MRIGNEIRAYAIEPLKDPVPRETRGTPEQADEREPVEAQLVDRETAPTTAAA